MNAKWLTLLQENNAIGIKYFIEKESADVNELNEHEESVLYVALKSRCATDIIEYLILKGANINDFDENGVSIFDLAITYDYIELVKTIIDSGRDVNKTERKSGFTPLMAAVCYGRKEIVELLLAHGANKDTVDGSKLSVFDYARKMNKKTILKILEAT